MRRLTRLALLVPLLLGVACSNGSTPNPQVGGNAQAAALANHLEGLGQVFIGAFPEAIDALGAALDPATAAAAGISFERDTSPGADPNAFLFEIPLDPNGDGTNETLLTGSIVFDSDPLLNPFAIAGTITAMSQGPFGDFNAMVAFRSIGTGIEISGMGTHTSATSEHITTIEIDPANPILLSVVDEEQGAVANACSMNAAGPARVSVELPDIGKYAALWTFVRELLPVRVTESLFTAPDETQEPMDDSTVTVEQCDPFVPGPVAPTGCVFPTDEAMANASWETFDEILPPGASHSAGVENDLAEIDTAPARFSRFDVDEGEEVLVLHRKVDATYAPLVDGPSIGVDTRVRVQNSGALSISIQSIVYQEQPGGGIKEFIGGGSALANIGHGTRVDLTLGGNRFNYTASDGSNPNFTDGGAMTFGYRIRCVHDGTVAGQVQMTVYADNFAIEVFCDD